MILVHEGDEPLPITAFGNEDFPSPINFPEKPITPADCVQRTFTTLRVLHQLLLPAMSLVDNLCSLLQLKGPYLYDCSQWSDEEQACSNAF